MKLMRAALLGAATVVLADPASAYCLGGNFAGPYMGANAGFGHLRAEQSAVAEPDASGNATSFVGGLHAGYNVQCREWVVGLETDINYANFSADSSWPDPIFLHSEVDWFGTVRARLGVTVHDTILVYATGGLAYADVSHRLSDPTPPLGAPPFSQTNSSIKTGWTIGGGLEFLRSERLLLRGEVLYVDPGNETRTYILAGCALCTGTAKWEDSFWVARLGLSIKLGREEPAPLK